MLAQTVLKSVIIQGMPKKPMINLKRLATLMDKKNYGMGELAEYSGVKYDTVYSIVKGRRTNSSADTLRRIADALDTSIDYLLGDTDDPAPPVQRLPEPIRQLALIANRLSGVRQDELLRIAATLEQLEREQPTYVMPAQVMDVLLTLAEKLGAGDVLVELQAMIPQHAMGRGDDLAGNDDAGDSQ